MVTDYPYLIEHKIRVIGYTDRKWYIDSPIEDLKSHRKFWVLAKKPLFKLDWNLIDYQLTYPFINDKFNFFQYVV